MESRKLRSAGPIRDDRVDILGVGVSPINLDDAVATIERWIGERSRKYVCITGVHGVMESRRNQRLRRIHNDAGMVTPDGMPLVWLSRFLGKRRTERVYGPDLMRKMTAVSSLRGYRQFYYGGAEGVADKLKQALITAHPKLDVVGTLCPPFRELMPEEDQAVVAAINAARPDIVWVGLSTPKQEFWMANHLGRIEAPVIIGVGAAFDFLAGAKRQAPLWMQRHGFEWLFRLCSEPRRLWRRYAYIVPGFTILAVGEFLRRAIRSSSAARGVWHTSEHGWKPERRSRNVEPEFEMRPANGGGGPGRVAGSICVREDDARRDNGVAGQWPALRLGKVANARDGAGGSGGG